MGYGVFVIVLGGVLVAVSLLRRWSPDSSAQGECHVISDTLAVRRPEDQDKCHVIRDTTKERARRPAAPTLIAGIVIVLAAGEMVGLRHLARSPGRGAVGVVLAADGRNPVELPAFLGIEWTGRAQAVTAIERDILPPDTGFSRKLYFSHRDPAKQVFLSIVLSGRDRTSIHRPELCLVGQGWTIAETAGHRFTYPKPAGGAFPATLLRVRREVQTPRGQGAVPQLVAYWFVGGDGVVATHGQRFWRDGWNRVVHGRADRWAYVLMQTEAADGEAAALARMQAVLNETLPVFQKAFAERSPGKKS
jgi:EpsI family protein